MKTDISPRPQEFYQSDRLEFRFRRADDAPALFALVDSNRDHLSPWMPWVESTKSIEDSENYFEMAREEWDSGEMFDFTVFLRDQNICVGSGGIHTIDWKNRTACLGYWIGKEYIGQGFASEAVRTFESICQKLGIHRVIINCDLGNGASQRVAEKCGYVFESLMMDVRFSKGKPVHGLQYVKLLNDPIPHAITENFPQGFYAKFVDPTEFENLTKNFIEEENGPAHLLPEQYWPQKIESDFKFTEYRYLLVYFKDTLAAWSFGNKMDLHTFRMTSSVVRKEFRGMKLYSRILDIFIQDCREKGYLKIRSSHYLDNNQVLTAKLKKGFHITGMNLNPITGQMVDLTLFLNKKSLEIFRYRTGSQAPSQEIKDIFNLSSQK